MSQFLLHDTLLYILSLVATNLLTSILSGTLGQIALYHDLHQFLKKVVLGFLLSLALALVGSL